MYAKVENNQIVRANSNLGSFGLSPETTVAQREAQGVYEVIYDNTNLKSSRYYWNGAESMVFANNAVTASYAPATGKDVEDKNAVDENIIYPLVDWKVDKQDVLDWWEDQSFDLAIPEHFGNCVWCWKKSYKKLMTIMIEDPSAFDFQERMENKYGKTGAMAQHLGKNGVLKNQTSMKFFRGFKSVADIKEMITEDFEKFTDLHHLHITDGCGESCDPWHTDDASNKILVHQILDNL